MIKEREVEFQLTVRAYYDESFNPEELRLELLKTLKNDNWDCALDLNKMAPKQIYKK